MWSRRAVLAALLLALSPAPAAGHGEGLPYSTGIALRPGDDQTILLAVTFGALLSVDDGATFHYVCEEAMGYGGLYDPEFEIGADGAIYVTSFDGLRRSTD